MGGGSPPMSHSGAVRFTSGPPAVNIIDETFIDAPPRLLAAVVADRRNHASWWPHLRLELALDRGDRGQRWRVTGQITGSMEIWVEPFWEGAIVHHYVRGTAAAGAPRDVAVRHTCRWKRSVTRLKDQMESMPRGRGL